MKNLTFSSIDTNGVLEAQKYIKASFQKGLDISPDGLEHNLIDFIALYCAYQIINNLEHQNKKEIIKKCSILSVYLGNQQNMFKYFGFLIKKEGKEQLALDNLHFFIDLFEELILENKANLPAIIMHIEYLEDAFYRMHKRNRIGMLQIESSFIDDFNSVKNYIYSIDLEQKLTVRTNSHTNVRKI